MGLSENSHAKIDKETQSPLLKIFKEIMTRERDDPEKRNLLHKSKEDKKRRLYSVSKKSDRRSCDSSSSEHRKKGGSYKTSSTEERAEFLNKPRSQSAPYQSEKKNSWWCWTFVSQQNEQPSKKSEDTCSCGTCALKKISSEYACVCYLLLLFTISIIVAFLVVFGTVPSSPQECPCKETTTTTTTCPPKCSKCKSSDSERLKRKIEMLNNKKFEKDFVGLDEFRKNNDKGNDDGLGLNDAPGVSGIDFGPSFRELNSADEAEHKLLNDDYLLDILKPELNLNNIDSSEKLREFYKKLIQTDAKIKTLKKISESDAPYVEEDVFKPTERSRRSIKHFHFPKRYRVIRPRRSLFRKHQTNETDGTKKIGKKTRLKRLGNETEEPTGFIIEKKKLLVQYKPTGKKRIPVKKCQHAPGGSHTHEKLMMHPFYKNTQRLDMLLDKFLNKNLPEIMTDPFGLNDLFSQDKLNKQCKHPKPHKNVNIISTDPLEDQIPKPKQKLKNKKAGGHKTTQDNIEAAGDALDISKILNPESTTPYEKFLRKNKLNMVEKVRNEKKKFVTPNDSTFEVLLSISTIMNSDTQRQPKATTEFNGLMMPIKDRIHNLRKLMQIEIGEEEENLGYEDFKEVLTDENENHNEMDKPEQRKRRESAEAQDPKAHSDKFKFNPPQGILNPNWKGAMPLYPDEINSIITNKQIDVPKPTLDIEELDYGQRKIRDLSDVEYVEDYLANKYNKLVQQAQAYSDYGVLDGKKESRNEEESPTVHTAPNHKIKLLTDGNVFKASLLERLKRGKPATTQPPKSNIPALQDNDARNLECEKDNNIEVMWGAQTGSKKYISGKYAEGIRFELQPTTKSREDVDYNRNLLKMVSKHVKLKFTPGQPKQQSSQFIPSSFISIYPNVDLVYSTKLPTEITKEEVDNNENEIVVDMNRRARHLLSTEFENSRDFREYKDSTGYRGANRENNTINIDRFIDKLHMNKLSDSSLALKKYIDEATEKNIKIYSIPQAYYPKNVADDNANMPSKASTPSDQLKDPTVASNFEPKAPPNSIVTINKSFVNLDDTAPDNFLGKILMSVNDPEFGQQNFNLVFDIPLIMNFKEELMMMNDSMNYPNVYSDIFTDSTIEQQVTETKSYYSEEPYQNWSPARRLKRESEVTATCSDESTTQMFPEKNSKVYQNADKKRDEAINAKVIVTVAPVSSSSSKSSVPASSSMGLIVANRNISALNDTSKTNRSANYSSKLLAKGDNMTLSDFFAFVGNWFKTLEYVKMDKPRKSSGSVLTDMLITLNSSSTDTNITTTTTDSAYPMYDSDMIENIGHRSRVLLSIEDFTVNVTDVTLVSITNTDNASDNATTVDGNVSNGTKSTTVVTNHRSNVTTTNKNKFKKSKISPPKQKKPRKFRAIVKRNADDSNLIFWDDMYDDEYGIQTDKMDNYMKSKIDDSVVDKQVKKKDFLKRSGRWVQNKIRKLARKINPHSDAVASIHSDKERVSRSIERDENFGLVYNPESHGNRVYNHPFEKEREKEGRYVIEEDYPDVDQKSLFAALSANMKEVCKKAAKAVQETRNVDTLPHNKKKGVSDEEFKQGSIANALMQELVRLLTDLVDFQVQQKTCRKLPPDLQAFLEWLTYSKDEPENPEEQSVNEEQSELIFKPLSQEYDELEQDELRDRPEDKVFPNAAKPGDRQEHISPGDRIHYLEAVHSIQELLEEFDNMPDDEKSKMTGVKGYLKKQLAFLNNQLSAYDLFAFFDKHDKKRRTQFFDKYDRKKRHIFMKSQKTTKHRPRREPRKFVKNFGRKHTRTTSAFNEDAQVTDLMINKKVNENVEINCNENLHQELSKRNLKDVYYNAVAEAKKFSTAKRGPIHKTNEISTFRTSTGKRLH